MVCTVTQQGATIVLSVNVPNARQLSKFLHLLSSKFTIKLSLKIQTYLKGPFIYNPAKNLIIFPMQTGQ